MKQSFSKPPPPYSTVSTPDLIKYSYSTLTHSVSTTSSPIHAPSTVMLNDHAYQDNLMNMVHILNSSIMTTQIQNDVRSESLNLLINQNHNIFNSDPQIRDSLSISSEDSHLATEKYDDNLRNYQIAYNTLRNKNIESYQNMTNKNMLHKDHNNYNQNTLDQDFLQMCRIGHNKENEEHINYGMLRKLDVKEDAYIKHISDSSLDATQIVQVTTYSSYNELQNHLDYIVKSNLQVANETRPTHNLTAFNILSPSDTEAIAVRAARMVDMLSEENRVLRKTLEQQSWKLSHIQRLELDLEKTQKGHEVLIIANEKREKLENNLRAKMEIEIKRLRETNQELLEHLQLFSAHNHSSNIQETSSEKQGMNFLTKSGKPGHNSPLLTGSIDNLTSELNKKDVVIAQLIAQNKDLIASNEKKEIEMAAQKATLNEQLLQLEVMQKALLHAQANILRLEEIISSLADNFPPFIRKLLKDQLLTSTSVIHDNVTGNGTHANSNHSQSFNNINSNTTDPTSHRDQVRRGNVPNKSDPTLNFDGTNSLDPSHKNLSSRYSVLGDGSTAYDRRSLLPLATTVHCLDRSEGGGSSMRSLTAATVPSCGNLDGTLKSPPTFTRALQSQANQTQSYNKISSLNIPYSSHTSITPHAVEHPSASFMDCHLLERIKTLQSSLVHKESLIMDLLKNCPLESQGTSHSILPSNVPTYESYTNLPKIKSNSESRIRMDDDLMTTTLNDMMTRYLVPPSYFTTPHLGLAPVSVSNSLNNDQNNLYPRSLSYPYSETHTQQDRYERTDELACENKIKTGSQNKFGESAHRNDVNDDTEKKTIYKI